MGHKRQHYVPLSYLQAWCDPKCPQGQSPYVWLTLVDGGQAKKKSPKKILRETDMYTVVGANGERDLSIERSLSRIEGKFARIRRDKLNKRRQLTLEEAAAVCTFVAAMYGRTRTYRQHLRSTWGRALDLMEKVEEAHKNASPEQREQMQRALRPTGAPGESERGILKGEVAEMVDNPLQNMLPVMVQVIAPQLIQIPWVVMVAPSDCAFVTSDTLCVVRQGKLRDTKNAIRRWASLPDHRSDHAAVSSSDDRFREQAKRQRRILDRGVPA